MTDFLALANEALCYEGADTYLGATAEQLADVLAANTDLWTPATDDTSWSIDDEDGFMAALAAHLMVGHRHDGTIGIGSYWHLSATDSTTEARVYAAAVAPTFEMIEVDETEQCFGTGFGTIRHGGSGPGSYIWWAAGSAGWIRPTQHTVPGGWNIVSMVGVPHAGWVAASGHCQTGNVPQMGDPYPRRVWYRGVTVEEVRKGLVGALAASWTADRADTENNFGRAPIVQLRYLLPEARDHVSVDGDDADFDYETWNTGVVAAVREVFPEATEVKSDEWTYTFDLGGGDMLVITDNTGYMTDAQLLRNDAWDIKITEEW